MVIHLALSEFCSPQCLRFEPHFAARKLLKLNISILFVNANFSPLSPIQVLFSLRGLFDLPFHELIIKKVTSRNCVFCLKKYCFCICTTLWQKAKQ